MSGAAVDPASNLVLWALLSVSGAAWFLIAWCWLALRRDASAGRAGLAGLEGALAALPEHRSRAVRAWMTAHPCALARAVEGVLALRSLRSAELERRAGALAEREARLLAPHLHLVGALGAAALLLGLLGTVLGMVATFASLGRAEAVAAGRLAGGINAALLTTQVGLIVALSVYPLQHHLHQRRQAAQDRMLSVLRRVNARLRPE